MLLRPAKASIHLFRRKVIKNQWDIVDKSLFFIAFAGVSSIFPFNLGLLVNWYCILDAFDLTSY